MEEKQSFSGFIIIDKPIKITSFDVIYKLRKITGIKKIGHAGTLDPLATGVLLVAIGREATREIDNLVQKDKKYNTEIDLSANTKTQDREGEITAKFAEKKITKKQIKEVLNKFIGPQKQIPPMFSAKKVGGKKLYELARKGKEVKREANDIEVYKLELLKYKWPILEINIKCSKGTYIRSLATDIGKELGFGGHLASLRRTAIGEYDIKKAKKLEEINTNNWYKFLFKP